jgi:hypothetical protein
MFRMVLFNASMDTLINNTRYLPGNYSPVLVFGTATDFYNVYSRVYKFYNTGN